MSPMIQVTVMEKKTLGRYLNESLCARGFQARALRNGLPLRCRFEGQKL
jgi:hypothetical protein